MRPNFLTSPGCWLRTPRHATSPIDNACAITVHQAVGSLQRAILSWLAVLALGVLAFHFISGAV